MSGNKTPVLPSLDAGTMPGRAATVPADGEADALQASGGRLATRAWEWLWARPLLIVLGAHTLFCVGIWNARAGYAEETYNVVSAFQVLRSGHLNPSLYVNLLAFLLRYVTPDPLTALTALKYIASLLATIALWLALRPFTGRLRKGSLLFACMLWIASAFNAPLIQSTSLSLFTFATMLLALAGLLRRVSLPGLTALCALGPLAAMMRPEYFLPLILACLLDGAWAFGRLTQDRAARVRRWLAWGGGLAALAVLITLWIVPPPSFKKKAAALDQYALVGLAQCYAGFYHHEHRQEVFDPATEYQATIDRVFGRPRSFSEAARNNPVELARYLAFNTAHNLFVEMPKNLLGRYREQWESPRGWAYWAVRVVLLAGTIAGARHVYQTRTTLRNPGGGLARGLRAEGPLARSLILLAVLASATLPALVLLIGLRRYYLACAPLFFLGVAYCVDCLVSQSGLGRFERWLAVLGVVCFCGPNYLAPRPNEEIDAVRQLAPVVRQSPTIAAWWAEPYAVLGLGGRASSLSLFNDIKAADLTEGRVDILVLDENFRRSRTWAEQRAFFEAFERQPDQFGFRKVTEARTGKVEVYYKPASGR